MLFKFLMITLLIALSMVNKEGKAANSDYLNKSDGFKNVTDNILSVVANGEPGIMVTVLLVMI